MFRLRTFIRFLIFKAAGSFAFLSFHPPFWIIIMVVVVAFLSFFACQMPRPRCTNCTEPLDEKHYELDDDSRLRKLCASCLIRESAKRPTKTVKIILG